MFKGRKKLLITVAAALTAICLTAGLTFAWFTNQVTAAVGSVAAGFVQIELTADTASAVELYPGEDGQDFTFTLTNDSNRGVYAYIDLTSELQKYLYPTSDYGYAADDPWSVNIWYLSADDNAALQALSIAERMAAWTPTPVTAADPVVIDDAVIKAAAGYQGQDADGKYWFHLASGASVDFSVNVALDSTAGNEYMYSVFSLADATAWAIQDTQAAWDSLGITLH